MKLAKERERERPDFSLLKFAMLLYSTLNFVIKPLVLASMYIFVESVVSLFVCVFASTFSNLALNLRK